MAYLDGHQWTAEQGAAIKAMRAKDNPNLVRECYLRDTGELAGEGQRAFMDWCEAKVHEWKARTDALGYVWPCWCIGTVGMTQTYHEWLKERVGL